MAKIIKFALELKDGNSARTIEDLRQHFDLEKVVAYFMNGRLLTWLKHRHLDEEAAALEKLSIEDTEFAQKLCEILGVAYEEHRTAGEKIDANALMEDHERLNRLRQVTTAPEILAKIDRVAFDENDMRRLAFDADLEVYLCNGRFSIPLNEQNKHYIGIGKAEAVIVSDEWIDFEKKRIMFTNVNFDEGYRKVIEAKSWNDKGEQALSTGNFKEALQWFRKAADQGNGIAMKNIGNLYHDGKGVSQDYEKAMSWYKKALKHSDSRGMAMNNIGNMYLGGRGVAKDYEKARQWFEQAVKEGNKSGFWNIGVMYDNGYGVSKDSQTARKWFIKAAEAGHEKAIKWMSEQ